MPASDSVEFDYVAGYTKPTHEFGATFGDEFHAEAVQELLLSMQGYTQRGVTLAAGQGILSSGTILARHGASGKYFAYQAAATDGRQTALGVLRDSRDTGGPGAASLSAWNSNTNGVNPDGITLVGGTYTPPASPAGKVATDCLGNLVYRGVLNGNMVSGTDTVSLVSGTGGVVGIAGPGSVNGALTQLGARIVQFGVYPASGLPVGTPQFPGGPMDGQFSADSGPQQQGPSAFIF